MIFNEEVMYREKSSIVTDTTNVAPYEFEFVNLNELLEITVQGRIISDKGE